MRFKVGDRVRIKSLDWYNENKDEDGDILLMVTTHSKFNFMKPQSDFCGKIVTIEGVYSNFYTITDPKTDFYWTDEMIECKVEEEPNDCEKCGLTRNSIKCLFMDNCPYNKQKNIIEGLAEEMSLDKAGQMTDFEYEGLAYTLPEGYIFKDENGNVINATKIVLEKKKKEYPKTFLECCDVLGIEDTISRGVKGYKSNLLDTFQKLLICRDAYWKIAGEEMGLGKPWSPSGNEDCFVISRSCGEVYLYSSAGDCEPFEFPTEEMRDAFYENFKEGIESVKELL